MPDTCDLHHKMLEKSTFFQVIALIITLAGLACGAVVMTSASADSMQAVQRDVDHQRTAVKDLRQEMNARFDRLDSKLDALAERRNR